MSPIGRKPLLRLLVAPAVLCAAGFAAALGAVLQFSLRAYVPGSLDAGGLTLANFAALLHPLYGRVFLDTVWICFLTALLTLIAGYPLAFVLVHARRATLKSAILVITVTPLFLGEVVRTYSWIVVLGNNGFLNSLLLRAGLIEAPLQLMFTRLGVITALVHVTLPMSRQVILTALLITVLPMLGDYYTNQLMSGAASTSMIGNLIEGQLGTPGLEGQGAVLSLLLLLVLLVPMIYYVIATNRSSQVAS